MDIRSTRSHADEATRFPLVASFTESSWWEQSYMVCTERGLEPKSCFHKPKLPPTPVSGNRFYQALWPKFLLVKRTSCNF